MEPVILIHGGAAPIAEDRICGKMCGVEAAAREAYQVLIQGGSAVDAVETAVKTMESDEHFNAGYGSVLNLDGEVEMDASIMDGRDLSAGAVALVRDVEHPISLARLVREQSPHVLIAGPGASKFASEKGMKIVQPDSLVSDYSREILEKFKAMGKNADVMMGGTVGAVALDKSGNVAAGTSTGGTNGKLLGRIGDTPQIGSCTYADSKIAAVSCTGHGEAIIKVCLGFSIIKEIESGKTPTQATETCLQFLTTKTTSQAGAIAVSNKGDIGIFFTSSMMPWAYIKKDEMHSGLTLEDDDCCKC